jgi:predicted nucleotidyltransferase
MITQAERAAEKRREKLQEIERQVKEGSLTIRKLTAKERKRFPPRPPQEPTKGRARR